MSSSDPDQSSILEYFVKRHLFAVFFVSRFVDLITDVIISKTFVNRQERYLDLLICKINEVESKAHVSRGCLNRGIETRTSIAQWLSWYERGFTYEIT